MFFVILNSQPECKGSVLNCHTYSEDNFSRDIDKFKNFNLEVATTPLLSFKDSKPKNVLLKITKSHYFIEKTLNAINPPTRPAPQNIINPEKN